MSPLAGHAYSLVRTIPAGRCTTYGTLGRLLPTQVSGLTIGRWMAHAPADVPWQRVVGKTGALLIGRRDARLAEVQRELLLAEGVSFTEDGRVQLDTCYFEPFL